MIWVIKMQTLSAPATAPYSPLFVVATLVFAVIGSLLFIVYRLNPPLKIDRYLVRILIIALALRLVSIPVISIFLNEIQGAPYLLGQHGDDWSYHQESVALAHAWQTSTTYSAPKRLANYMGYVYFNAILYTTFSPSTLVARLANVVVSVASIVYTFKIASFVFDREIAKRTTLLIAIYPTHILFSALQYRDIHILFLSLVTLWELLQFRRTMRPTSLLICGVALALMSTISWQVAYGLLAIGGVYILFDRISAVTDYIREKELRLSTHIFFLLTAVISIGFFIDLLSPLIFGFFDPSNVDRLRDQRLSRYGLSSSMQSFIERWYILPLFLFAPLVLPLPTFVLGDFAVVSSITFPGRVIWTCLLPFFVYGVYWSVRIYPKRSFPLYGFILGMNVGLFLMFRLFGVRQLFILSPIYLMFCVVGLRSVSKPYRYFTPYLLVYFVGVFGYNLFRLFIL